MLTDISIVIIVKNGEKTIKNTLNSVKKFSDVVVYDNGSTDKTIKIAQSYVNVNLIQGDFLGFGPTKNKAATYAKNDWVLSLDSDEVIDNELLNDLGKISLNKDNLYSIFRQNFYQQQHIKHCWNNDIIVRLYAREKTAFSNQKVHEKILTNNLKINALQGFVNHYPYQNISDFIAKLDIYSNEFAKDNAGKKSSSPAKAILNAGFSFFKTYILKKGFLDGYVGLIIAFSHMATNFYKYIKLYELNKKL